MADLAVVPRELVTAGTVAFPPDAVLLAVEVTAPATITRDRVVRPAQYAGAGIGYFWRADDEDGVTRVSLRGEPAARGPRPRTAYSPLRPGPEQWRWLLCAWHR
jgi:hypothetical protein